MERVFTRDPLPIDAVLPELRATLRERTSVVLHAPPGAGKTTRIPLALMNEPWLAGRKIVMLEPRRLATRAAATRMARTIGESVGATVGYRIRAERRTSAATRIEVVTEGILTRMVQHDPTLEHVGLVIFDEFHERHLHADVGLALTLQSQSVLRDDLRILVMSATLETAAVATLLGDAPVVRSEGRSYPVEIRYVPPSPRLRMEANVAATIRSTLTSNTKSDTETTGDVLVFLPGAGEIHRVHTLLRDAELPPDVHVMPLFGNLPQDAQDAAITPSPTGERKVVLATAIAETSLTIEGVRVVIDAGLMRVPRFSPRSGMMHLDTIRVSRASTEQRCGRAGRLGPGVCYRLWTEHEQHALTPHTRPEILDADLAPLALELAVAGIVDPTTLRWIDVPPSGALAQARELLRELGAIDEHHRITSHGQRMATLGVHPRLAHMMLEGARLGALALACDLAALLSERDVLGSQQDTPTVDIRERVTFMRQARGRDMARVRHIRDESERWQRALTQFGFAQKMSLVDSATDDALAMYGVLLGYAYPDRIAQHRPGTMGRFLLRNGRGAALPHAEALSNAPYLVVADLDGQGTESRIYLAAALTEDELLEHFGDQLTHEDVVVWDATANAVRARRRERLGAITVRDAPWRDPDPMHIAHALVDAIARDAHGLERLPWTDAARQLQARVGFVRARDAMQGATQHAMQDTTWPDLSDATLRETMDTWLVPHLAGCTTLDGVQRLDLYDVLLSSLTWAQRTELDTRAPATYLTPAGSRIAIDYSDPLAPAIGVRLQEMFGVPDTPRVDRGTVPFTIHLLSPAHRPVQVTRDLAGFWKTSYFDVKKELKGRYPKHVWPDDPLHATPTRSAKRRT